MTEETHGPCISIFDITSENHDALVNRAMSMYLGEQCKFCGKMYKTLDDLKDTVYAGYHERLACDACWKIQENQDMTQPNPRWAAGAQVTWSDAHEAQYQKDLAEAFRLAYRSRVMISEYSLLTPCADAYLGRLREHMDEPTRHASVLWEHAYRKKAARQSYDS